jgi:CubicO group peptidase (beta-lactamase class C family)
MRTLLRFAAIPLFALSGLGHAQDVPAPAPVVAPAPTGVAGGTIARETLAAYVDGVVGAYMRDQGIAGVTVAVVDRSGSVLERGYGIAAQAPERAVDPTLTLFRIGSTTKTFTYVAAMQLVEAGKLGLDDDVNKYLPQPLHIAAGDYGTVRVWHLMTHTAGFEDSALGHLIGADPARVATLEDYLARYRPARVRAPGLHADYSNYSVALLGAIVARVSGEDYETYVERHLFAPLGMNHTTVRETLPAGNPRRVADALAQNFSTGFERDRDGFTAKGFEYISAVAPAGSGSSTAGDMARWMRMLIGAGTLDGASVINPDTFATMRQERFTNAPGVPGFAHGFFTGRYGEYTSLGHGGATLYFHTGMIVLPDAGFGVFVSTNTDTGYKLARELPRLVIEYVLPLARSTPVAATDAGADLSRFVGSYLGERRSFTTVESFISANGSLASVGVDGGDLVISTSQGARRYRRTGPTSFRAVEGNDTLSFVETDGQISGFSAGGGNVMYARAGVTDNPGLVNALLAATGLASLLVLVAAWARRGLVPRARQSHPSGGRLPTAAIVAASVLWLAFLAAVAIAAAEMARLGNDLVHAYPTASLRSAVGMGYLAAFASVIATLLVPSAWSARGWSFSRKLRYTAVVAAMLITTLLLVRWRLLFAPFFPAG